MATWTTTETRTETKERSWSLVVWDNIKCAVRWASDGGSYPTPADYIAALRAEPGDVREAVLHGICSDPQQWSEDIERLKSALATVTGERDSLSRAYAAVVASEIRLRAQLDGAAAAIAAEDEPAGVGCPVECRDIDLTKKPCVAFRGGYRDGLWSPLPRVLAEIARSQPAALIAAADKLRPVATTDRETRAVLALVEWTRGDGSRLLWRRQEDGLLCVNAISCADPDTALALCARLGIEVE